MTVQNAFKKFYVAAFQKLAQSDLTENYWNVKIDFDKQIPFNRQTIATQIDERFSELFFDTLTDSYLNSNISLEVNYLRGDIQNVIDTQNDEGNSYYFDQLKRFENVGQYNGYFDNLNDAQIQQLQNDCNSLIGQIEEPHTSIYSDLMILAEIEWDWIVN